MTLNPVLSQAEIAVIVNKNNSVTINAEEIKGIFLGKINTFPNGLEAIPLVQKSKTPIANEFTKKVLKKTNSQVQAYWSKLVFTGQGTSPKELSNNKKVISIVSSNLNTIGYINAKDIPDNVRVINKF
jgi:ABC-type phosphate transport system substrate-binding protein